MSLQRTFMHLALFTFAACALTACGSHYRNSSPDYHINAMERTDAMPYCVKDRCNRVPKDWNKDK